jgi:hypothetical protein
MGAIETKLAKRKTPTKPCGGPYQSLPKPRKKGFSSVPPPQRERILRRYIEGQSIRRISREEGRARETVTKIVRSANEVESYVQRMQEAYIRLGAEAVQAVRYAIVVKKDGWLAHQLLKDVGVASTTCPRCGYRS